MLTKTEHNSGRRFLPYYEDEYMSKGVSILEVDATVYLPDAKQTGLTSALPVHLTYPLPAAHRSVTAAPKGCKDPRYTISCARVL